MLFRLPGESVGWATGHIICNIPKIIWIYLTYPSVKEPIESMWKGEAKLGKQLGELSVYHIQVDPFIFLKEGDWLLNPQNFWTD